MEEKKILYFEISKELHSRVKKIANFLTIKDSQLMTYLILNGLNSYKNEKYDLVKTESMQKEIEKLKKKRNHLYYEYYKNNENDDIGDKIYKNNLKLKQRIKKCEVEIYKKDYDNLYSLAKKLNGSMEELTVGLIKAELKNYKYLGDQYFWQADLLEDANYNHRREIRIHVPDVIYQSIENKALSYNFKTSVYMSLLMEEYFKSQLSE